MALVLGTNCGFVTSAPVDDPGELSYAIDNYVLLVGDTTPATALKILQVGWWCDNNPQEANFEVGLYAADAEGGAAGTLLYANQTNNAGSAGGTWKTVDVDWEILPNTDYWIGVQVDDTATQTNTNYKTSGGKTQANPSEPTLDDPYSGGTGISSWMYAIYALVEEVEAEATTHGRLTSYVY